MAVSRLAAPTTVGQIMEENGVRFISFDGATWSLYKLNEDNVAPIPPEVPAVERITDAQRAELVQHSLHLLRWYHLVALQAQ